MNQKLFYSLEETDYLNYQLFTASKSLNIINKRRRNRFILPLILIALGLIPRFDFTETFTQIYLLLASLWFLLYPFYDRKLYINHFKKHIAENYQNNFNRNSSIEFLENYLQINQEESESKTDFKEIIEINEVPSAFYLKLKSSQSVIIPKHKIINCLEFTEYLKEFSENKSIKFNHFPNWKWK